MESCMYVICIPLHSESSCVYTTLDSCQSPIAFVVIMSKSLSMHYGMCLPIDLDPRYRSHGESAFVTLLRDKISHLV